MYKTSKKSQLEWARIKHDEVIQSVIYDYYEGTQMMTRFPSCTIEKRKKEKKKEKKNFFFRLLLALGNLPVAFFGVPSTKTTEPSEKKNVESNFLQSPTGESRRDFSAEPTGQSRSRSGVPSLGTCRNLSELIGTVPPGVTCCFLFCSVVWQSS